MVVTERGLVGAGRQTFLPSSSSPHLCSFIQPPFLLARHGAGQDRGCIGGQGRHWPCLCRAWHLVRTRASLQMTPPIAKCPATALLSAVGCGAGVQGSSSGCPGDFPRKVTFELSVSDGEGSFRQGRKRNPGRGHPEVGRSAGRGPCTKEGAPHKLGQMDE